MVEEFAPAAGWDAASPRGNFHGHYVKPKEGRVKCYVRFPRLLDCLRVIVQSDDPDYMDDPAAGEFAVVDVVTKEKGFFEMPFGASPENVTAMIEGQFARSATRIGAKLWFV